MFKGKHFHGARGDEYCLEPSLQIIFFYKPVVCQARDKVLPDIQSVWSDKNIFPHLFKKNLRE